MKLRVTIDIDVGDHMDGWRDEEIRQVLYDEIVNFIHIKHAEDLAEVVFRNSAHPAPIFTVEGYERQLATGQHYDRWSKFTYRPDWKFKKL